MRKGLSIEELGDLLVLPLNATLATYRRDGSVLLSPVWHEWSDGGFSIFTSATDVKLRHIERQGRAAAVVADHTKPYRGIEVSGEPTIIRDPDAANTTVLRICSRYLGEDRAKLYVASVWTVPSVVLRLTPGQLRTWDFADDEELLDLSPR